jgi:hypothetical protein
MAAADRGMSTTGMSFAVIARGLAGLHLLHLLRRNEGVEFLLRLLMDLPNFLLALLRSKRLIRAYGFDFRARLLLDFPTLLHGRLGNPGYFPTGWLVRMGNCTRMPWRWLRTNRDSLGRCALG